MAKTHHSARKAKPKKRGRKGSRKSAPSLATLKKRLAHLAKMRG